MYGGEHRQWVDFSFSCDCVVRTQKRRTCVEPGMLRVGLLLSNSSLEANSLFYSSRRQALVVNLAPRTCFYNQGWAFFSCCSLLLVVVVAVTVVASWIRMNEAILQQRMTQWKGAFGDVFEHTNATRLDIQSVDFELPRELVLPMRKRTANNDPIESSRDFLADHERERSLSGETTPRYRDSYSSRIRKSQFFLYFCLNRQRFTALSGTIRQAHLVRSPHQPM